MEALKPISRVDIDTICNSVDLVPALDSHSSAMATKVFRERLRKQLTGKKWKGGEQALNAMIAYVTKRHNLACIPDYTFVGLQSSEALSKEIAQASQDAFKVVVKVMVISALVDSMKSITETVKDRKDPKCIVHFDKGYSKLGNFTLQEAIAMRSVFVSTTISQLFKSPPLIGILEEFEGDGVVPELRQLRSKCMERYSTRLLPHGVWNKLAASIPSGEGFSTSVLIMRCVFDPAAMYARNVGMYSLTNAITDILSQFANDHKFCLAPSSLKDGIIDICVTGPRGREVYTDEFMTKFDAESLVLDKIVEPSISFHTTGGIRGIVDMVVNRVDLTRLLTTKQPHRYFVAECGRKLWADANDLPLTNLDDYVAAVQAEEVFDTDILLYSDGVVSYVYEDREIPEYPTSDELDNAYINYFMSLHDGVTLESLWLIELDLVAMRRMGVTWEDEMRPMLEHCGIRILEVFNHELVDLPYYIYVDSEIDSSETITSVLGAESVGIDQLPKEALSTYRKWAAVIQEEDEFESEPDKFYEKHKAEVSQRVGKYTYATLSLSKKGTSKTKKYAKYLDVTPYEWHVLPHSYQDIIEVPFVDRHRTYSNDWYTNTFLMGADCARNIYTDEFYMLASVQSNTDPRHMELYCDVVFSKGYPVGCGQRGGDDHGSGALSQMGTVQQKKQLSMAYNTEAEGIESSDVATYYGAARIGADVKERQAAADLKSYYSQQELMKIRYGSQAVLQPDKTVTFASHEDTTDIAVRSFFIGRDPFKVASDTLALALFPNEPTMTKTATDIIVGSEDFVSRVVDGVPGKMKYLSNRVSYRTREIVPKLPENTHIVDLDELLVFMLANPFIAAGV